MTAPVAPMEARCEHCLDTGSVSKQVDGFQDCHYCQASNLKKALIAEAERGNWSHHYCDSDMLWAAYLFAQRQAAPVAQPAQQVEAVGQVPIAWLEAEESARGQNPSLVFGIHSMLYSTRICFAKPTGSNPVWPLYTAPQLEAQQAGDVALKEAVAKFIKAKGRFHTERCYLELFAAYDAIAQGRKA